MRSFRDYISYAEKQLKAAVIESENRGDTDLNWLLIPATILAWSAIESFTNQMLDVFSALPKEKFELHERALMLEKKLRLVDRGESIGQFILEGKEYRRLEDKIFFLLSKFGGKSKTSIKGGTLWNRFVEFKDARDALIHPRQDSGVDLNTDKVETFIETARLVIQFVSEGVLDKKIYF